MTARSWSGVASSPASFTALQWGMLKRVYKIGKSGNGPGGGDEATYISQKDVEKCTEFKENSLKLGYI